MRKTMTPLDFSRAAYILFNSENVEQIKIGRKMNRVLMRVSRLEPKRVTISGTPREISIVSDTLRKVKSMPKYW